MAGKYVDPVIAKVIELMKEHGPSEIKKWYPSDVLSVPKRELPVAYIAKDNTVIMTASTMEDDNIMPLVLGVIYDYTRDLSKGWDVASGAQSLYRIMESRGQSNPAKPYELDPGSIAYLLRANQVLDGGKNLWLSVGPNEQVMIEYGLGVERRGPGIYSIEATVRFTARVQTGRPGL